MLNEKKNSVDLCCFKFGEIKKKKFQGGHQPCKFFKNTKKNVGCKFVLL